MLSDYDKSLLQIARDAIYHQFTGQHLVDTKEIIKKYPELSKPRAVFVTLSKNNQLRGCIGSIENYRSLINDITGNAISAAFNDSRFNSLEPDELDEITIEISMLSNPKQVSYKSVEDLMTRISPLTDGIILSQGYQRAVFLPQVWTKVTGFDEFFEHLCKKAGLFTNCLQYFPKIEIFNVTIIEEE